ncbi:hypothetical protein AB0J80_07580 [Actinoplanes sp. NPDC049548]|uniref:hypothetical protein n=1 Tax=Actinoplanes sp. NPDC049548 TaxID=3155152 RepID=UPI0034143C45
MNRRTLLVTAGWAGAAVLAVLVGIAMIGDIGADLTDAGSRPRTEAQVARELASLPSAAPSVPSASPARSRPAPSVSQATGASPAAVSRTLATRGGTVVARCVAGRSQIVTMSPAPGFSLHEQDGNEGEFRSTSDNHDRVKFEVVCSSGRPALAAHGGGDD